MKKKSSVLYFAFVAAFGAFVVGLNLGGISGAIDILEKEFSLSSLGKGLVASALMIGCFFGALAGGRLSDKFGRKPMLMASGAVLLVSSLGCSLLSPNVALLDIFRIFAGLGVGVLSAVISTYITEIAPAAKRGTYVSFYQVFVVIGIFVAYLANFIMSGWDNNWHWMLGVPIVFAIIDILMLFSLPESPRWLIQQGRSDEAKAVIAKFDISEKEAEEMFSASSRTEEKSVAFKELFKGTAAKIVFLGSMLAFFQQITGINVVINYAPGILSSIGIASNPLLQTVFIGIANLVFTLIALWLVEKAGRKVLLIIGCAGSGLSLAYMAYAFSIPNPSDVAILIAILAYIGFFALSLSPLMFVVTAEIYPSKIRGTAMALSTGISWACAFLVVQFFPWMENALGSNVSFGIFAALCFAAGAFIMLFIPETKGKSLEEIERFFYKNRK